jgi:hypothetical protein
MAVTQSSSSGVAARRRLAIIAAHAVEGGGGSSARPSTSTWRPTVGVNTADAVGAAAAEAEPMAEMSDREKFLIDLHGYLVVPNVLSPHEVAELNAATDACWDSEYTDGAGEVHPCRQRGHQSVAFDEMRGMLEWAKPHCVPFRNLLTHPKLVPYMNSLHGRGWRMDHAPFLIAVSTAQHSLTVSQSHAAVRCCLPPLLPAAGCRLLTAAPTPATGSPQPGVCCTVRMWLLPPCLGGRARVRLAGTSTGTLGTLSIVIAIATALCARVT